MITVCVSPAGVQNIVLLSIGISFIQTKLQSSDVADNKQFWRTIKPLLSDNLKSSDKITLAEGGEIINEDGKMQRF